MSLVDLIAGAEKLAQEDGGRRQRGAVQTLDRAQSEL